MKPITLTQADIQSLLADFSAAAAKCSFWDTDTLTYKKPIIRVAEGNQRISLTFSAVAYAKMRELVRVSNVEVAWHGTVERINSKNYLVTDIIVYPQTIDAATVNTDQQEYDNWMNALPCEVFGKVRLQGHSHVHMPPAPSSVDTFNQKRTLQLIGKNDYYISMIVNKRDEWTCRLYDEATNTLYDEKDIDLSVQPAAPETLTAALKDITAQYEHMAKRKTPITVYNTVCGSYAPFAAPTQTPASYHNADNASYYSNYEDDSYYTDDSPLYYGEDMPPYYNSSSYAFF